jgi:hypothetical protein
MDQSSPAARPAPGAAANIVLWVIAALVAWGRREQIKALLRKRQ